MEKINTKTLLLLEELKEQYNSLIIENNKNIKKINEYINQIISLREQIDILLENNKKYFKNIEMLNNELNYKNTEYERIIYKKNKFEKELLLYKKKYKELRFSYRYRIGNCIVEIIKNPLKIFYYFKKIILKVFKKLNITKRKKFKFNGISVIVPTYKKHCYLDECINSVLNQSLNSKKIEIILSVNGKDIEYYNYLKKKYKNNKIIKVIYTSQAGLSTGRNFAINYCSMDYIIFLDDDDYFSKGYLKELSSSLDNDIIIVCGRTIDKYENKIDDNTYINKELSKIEGGGKTKDYFLIGSLFTSACAKLYKKSLFQNMFTLFDENRAHTEDVVFWTDNFSKLNGYIYCCNSNGKESYFRRVLNNSMSRPSLEKEFTFYIEDRIEIINYISNKLYDLNLKTTDKRFLINKINAQTNKMIEYYNNLNLERKSEVLSLLNKNENFYLNKSKFSNIQGIAFCHNFSPSIDASAYVASKRLKEIEKLENKIVKWDIISSNMSNIRKTDLMFDMFYSSFVINSRTALMEPSYFNEKSQYQFGQKAFEYMKNIESEIVYSRSMFAGSHLAAYKYKEKYPNVKWYAEFSDPIYMNTNNEKRTYASIYKDDEEFLNSFWKDIEIYVYKNADKIIFTNDNQREYMIKYNEENNLNNLIREKSLVLNHPIIDKKFCNIVNSQYKIDKNYMNIGYFGSFYLNRNYEEMLSLLNNKKTILHLFISNAEEIRKNVKYDRIKINHYVNHFEFLNIASKMDYLFLNDINFNDEINPYLPSKLADYLTTGTKIIALVYKNSPLHNYNSNNIIKIEKLSLDFIDSLKKIL